MFDSHPRYQIEEEMRYTIKWVAITTIAMMALVTIYDLGLDYIYNRPQLLFFGAVSQGSYRSHFDNKIVCGMVKGWTKEPQCYCMLTEYDERLGKDVTLIASMEQSCKPLGGEAETEEHPDEIGN